MVQGQRRQPDIARGEKQGYGDGGASELGYGLDDDAEMAKLVPVSAVAGGQSGVRCLGAGGATGGVKG